jgi:hypothetical protein
MTPFLTQPIRAAHFPAINEGEPTACLTAISADCTLTATTWERFKYNFDRGQYGKPSIFERQAPIGAQIGMWWLYFKWQWLRDADGEYGALQQMLAAVFLVLGLLGGYVHWRRDRRSFWYFGTFVFSATLLLIYYLNFKYGYSQSPHLGESVDREVRDRDYFYLWSFSAWGVWAALGLVFVWESLAAMIGADQVRLGKETVEQPRERSWLLASPVLALALVPLVGNWDDASRAGHTYTRDFAHDILNSVEPYGILITVGDNDTFPLWYAQEVEKIRQDVIVANTSLLNTPWYVRQIIRNPVREYDAAKGPAIYRGKSWPKPTKAPLGEWTISGADSLPELYPVREEAVFRAQGIEARIPPQMLQRADLAVLQMIARAFPERPVYFSRTSGGYGHQLGFGQYLVTQGLARKLNPGVPTASPDTMLIPGEGWVDVQRTHALWTQVFEAPRSIIRAGEWVDRPSVGIPYLYVSTGAVLAEALFRKGDTTAANRVMETAQHVGRAVGMGDLFADAPAPQQDLLVPQGDSPPTTKVPIAP